MWGRDTSPCGRNKAARRGAFESPHTWSRKRLQHFLQTPANMRTLSLREAEKWAQSSSAYWWSGALVANVL